MEFFFIKFDIPGSVLVFFKSRIILSFDIVAVDLIPQAELRMDKK